MTGTEPRAFIVCGQYLGDSGVDALTGPLLSCVRGVDFGVFAVFPFLSGQEAGCDVSMAFSLSLLTCSYSSKSDILRVIRVSFWLNILL